MGLFVYLITKKTKTLAKHLPVKFVLFGDSVKVRTAYQLVSISICDPTTLYYSPETQFPQAWSWY